MTVSVGNRLPRAAIFDWDNTLVDSWATIHDAMNTTLAAMGHVQWTMEQTRERVRRSLREAFPDMFGDRWEDAREIFYQRFREVHLDMLEPLEGAEALLHLLAGRGVYLGVVSNKLGEHLRREAAHLGWDTLFARLVGATDTARDKPAPDPVELVLSPGGMAPGNDVWFVGDTWVDLECAHNSGCTGILIRETEPGRGEFDGCEPALYFSDHDEFADLVRSL